MPRSLSEEQVRLLRLRAQRLTGAPPGDVHEVVRAMGGIQAQDTAASRLAVRPRGAGLDAAAVRDACNLERSVVRTWAMRGTLHMLAAEDAGWLVALLGPGFAAANRRRRLQLGLDDDASERGLRAIGKVLGAHGPLPRGELVSRLAGEGVAVDRRSQAPAHLVAYAAMLGLVCRGPDLDGDEPTYVLVDDWVGGRRRALDPEAALAELTRRYLGAHGPATPADLAAWAGIAAGRARRGFELVAGELVEVEAAGAPAWTLGGAGPPRPGRGAPSVRLLYRFDDYLLGWRGRDQVLSPRFARRIHAGGGWIHPAVLVDGRVVGTWRLGTTAGGVTVAVEPFEPLHGTLRGLEAEAADLGRFLGATATLSVAGAA
jgi:Winged helix DNA-binding domain